MNARHRAAYLLAASVLVAGCATRYAIHGEGVFTDSDGKIVTNSLYRVETKRLFWFDHKGEVVWLVTRNRPNVRLQFDQVEGVGPLAAEVRPTDAVVVPSEYPDTVAGVIANCDSIDSFEDGTAQVRIFSKYRDDGWGVAGISQAYLAPSETPYEFEIQRHRLEDVAVPDWVRKSIE